MTIPRLFVDVDDTLLLYDSEGDTHPYGIWKDDSYHINKHLVKQIHRFREKYPDALIVVWSGGGTQYAKIVADLLLPNLDIVPMIKDRTTFPLVRMGDWVIDDENIEVIAYVHQPEVLMNLEDNTL